MASLVSELLPLADPIVLLVFGVALVLFLQNTVRLRKPRAVSLICALIISGLVLWVGFVRTSNDQNYFKLLRLRNQRYPSPESVLVELDRLEDMGTLDQYTMDEIEQKLAGNTSFYFWKRLDFSMRLSTAKEAKLYRIIGSSLVIFYLTFTPMPISCPKPARMLFALLFLGLSVCRLALYELYPDYLEEVTQRLYFLMSTYLDNWTVFSAATLLSFAQVALSLGFLVYFSLVRITREELISELDQTLKSAGDQLTEKTKTKLEAIVQKYAPLAEAFKQQQKGRKVVGVTLLSAGILFLGLMFYEELAG